MYGYRGNKNTYKTFASMHYLPNASGQSNI